MRCTPRPLDPQQGKRTKESGRGKQLSRMACFSWNQGECRYPACKYRHACTRCGGDHKIYQCPWLREKDGKSPRQGSHEGRRTASSVLTEDLFTEQWDSGSLVLCLFIVDKLL